LKYSWTARFQNDYRKLGEREQALFHAAVRKVNATYRDYRRNHDLGTLRWPTSLRVKRVTGALGVYELTWSFGRPAGRATFEFFKKGSQLGILWRRIGGHAIFKEP